jgi:hypothetical protein
LTIGGAPERPYWTIGAIGWSRSLIFASFIWPSGVYVIAYSRSTLLRLSCTLPPLAKRAKDNPINGPSL